MQAPTISNSQYAETDNTSDEKAVSTKLGKSTRKVIEKLPGRRESALAETEIGC